MKALEFKNCNLNGKQQGNHIEVCFPNKNNKEMYYTLKLINELKGIHYRLHSNSIFVDLRHCNIEDVSHGIIITEK